MASGASYCGYVGPYDVFTCMHAHNMQAYQVQNARVCMHQVEALTNLLYYNFVLVTLYLNFSFHCEV